MSRFAVVLLAAASLAHGQQKAPSGGYSAFDWNALEGHVRLPGGRDQKVRLKLDFRKDRTFTGTIVYEFGLSVAVYAVEGAVDKQGRIRFQEKPGITGVSELGGGTFEGKWVEGRGAWGALRLPPKPLQPGPPVECKFSLATMRALYGTGAR